MFSESVFDKTVFIVGSPKCGSTSLHAWMHGTKEFDLPMMKDTHYLNRLDFNIPEYLSYFDLTGKRICEVDQNVAISDVALENIGTNFPVSTVVYVIREPRKRIQSAYGWLRKMGQVKSFDEAMELYRPWMIDQGDYQKNLERMRRILPISIKIVVCRFEDMVKDESVCLSRLASELEVINYSEVLPRQNSTVEPRNRWIVRLAKSSFSILRRYDRKGLLARLKYSNFINSLLFGVDTKKLDVENELPLSLEVVSRNEAFLASLQFDCGVCVL